MTIDEFRKKYGPRFGMSDTTQVDRIINEVRRSHDELIADPIGWLADIYNMPIETPAPKRRPNLKLIIGGKHGK